MTINEKVIKARVYEIMQYEYNPKTGEDLHFNENNIIDGLEHKSIKQFAYIRHDKDIYTLEDEAKEDVKAGDLKAPHWHCVIHCPNKLALPTVAKWFNVPDNCVEVKKGHGAFLDAVEYLTHEDEKQQNSGKYLYSDEEVKSNFDFRLELIERNENRLKYGGDLNKKDRMRFDVRYLGKTLKQCREEDKKLYMDNEKDLTYLRLRYINELKPPKERINIYISGSGGAGKGLLSKAIATNIFEDITEDEDIFFTIGAEGAEFIGYDGQPVIIWNDKRAGEILRTLKGRGNAFEVFDPYPDRKNQNVKYSSVNLCNKVNIVNSVQDSISFLDGLAGEYIDRQGEKVLAEDKAQSYRRFPIVIEFGNDYYDLKVNRGFKNNTKDYFDFEEYLNIECNMQQIKVLCGDNEKLIKRLEKKAVEPIIREYQKIVNRPKEKMTEEEILKFFEHLGEQKQEEKQEENKDVDLLDFMNPDEDYSWTI